MPVVEVSDGMPVEPDHVYVIPPNRNMTIHAGLLRLAPRSEHSRLQHPIDDFSVALAEEQGSGAIGVVLSGTGSDGTYGLKAIKAAGGVTFAQDPKTAQWPAMPTNAIAAGSVDFVLSPKRIAAELARIARHPYVAEAKEIPDGADLDKICLVLGAAVGVDFRQYKRPTVRRRIARRMALQKIASLGRYLQILKQNPDEAKALAEDIFIHVTSFFRDPDCFEALKKQVLAKLRAKASPGDPIRIWVPGCSTGEEVYSIAMLLMEELGDQAGRIGVQFFGTDIQERAVDHARAGIYTDCGCRRRIPGSPETILHPNGRRLSNPEIDPRPLRLREAQSGQRPAVFAAGSHQLPERAHLHESRSAEENPVDFPVCSQIRGGSFPRKLGIHRRILRGLFGRGPEAPDLSAQAERIPFPRVSSQPGGVPGTGLRNPGGFTGGRPRRLPQGGGGSSAGALFPVRPGCRSEPPHPALPGRCQPVSRARHRPAEFPPAEDAAPRTGGRRTHRHPEGQKRGNPGPQGSCAL